MKGALFLVAFAACLALAFSLGKEYNLEADARALWAEWKNDNSRAFTSNLEDSKRFAIFVNNIRTIKELNAKYYGRTRFMLNKFADLSPEEFRAYYLNSKMPNDYKYVEGVSKMADPVPRELIGDIPKAVDWRKADPPVVTRVKNQGMCGSCWAFSTTGNLEGVWALGGNKLTELSEQNLVDCDHECTQGVCDAGCNGGLMENAFKYIINNGGIDTEEAYPYEGVDGPCRFKKEAIGAKMANYTFLPHDPEQMAYWVAKHGPIAIAADASMWQYYYTGVWYFPCGNQLNHGIIIVGYDTETSILGTEMPYWIVKNSWGENWGMDGYILIERGNNRCLVEDYPITALLK